MKTSELEYHIDQKNGLTHSIEKLNLMLNNGEVDWFICYDKEVGHIVAFDKYGRSWHFKMEKPENINSLNFVLRKLNFKGTPMEVAFVNGNEMSWYDWQDYRK